MSMSISGRRLGHTFEVVDERGVQQVVKLQELSIAGQWRGGETTYQIQCSKEGFILSITESTDVGTARPDDDGNGTWNDAAEGRWESMSPLAVTQQPLHEKPVKLFSASKVNGDKGDVRIFRFDPQYPYDLEVTHVTRDPERPKRNVQILRRHIPVHSKL
eukprot:TRINITY_DN32398_c0_g1_i1.p1 TRINITY_DN32398_c0_g1~~TRINITY_DN32398_c0_g1_i1.p1  ORF type:complete len:160 (+),score=58.83 TRINITY_DN32398_c0_g1_i1:70-549(+)